MGQSYRELIAWQKAMDFVWMSTEPPRPSRDETYALAGQLRRAAVAIPTNIAEGQARFSPNEFHFFWPSPRSGRGRNSTDDRAEPRYFTPEHGSTSGRAASWGNTERLIGAMRPAA